MAYVLFILIDFHNSYWCYCTQKSQSMGFSHEHSHFRPVAEFACHADDTHFSTDLRWHWIFKRSTVFPRGYFDMQLRDRCCDYKNPSSTLKNITLHQKHHHNPGIWRSLTFKIRLNDKPRIWEKRLLQTENPRHNNELMCNTEWGYCHLCT